MCTSVLVGKRASIDGSVIIGRNEDSGAVANLKTFKVFPAYKNSEKIYKSENTNITLKLPSNALRMTGTPSDDPNEIGAYTESAINEVNVAVSASESLFANERVLHLDPLVEDGIGEDAIVDIVCPYITSARQGVKYLGDLIEKHGSLEGNGILFADKDEAWYMEIVTGHHWAAQRIPDDCYAIAPNQVCIQEIDLDDGENFLYSSGIKEFVETNKLNPYREGFNFRKIFGTFTSHDRQYNTARAWYGHKCLRPDLEFEPESPDIPFIMKADRLISVADVEFILSSHYNDTVYDPIGNLGTEEEKRRYRSISLQRTHESHILQLRNDVDESVAGIHWLAFATTAFTPYIPFFSNINDTPDNFKNMTYKPSMDNAYWLFRVFSYFAEKNHKKMDKEIRDYLKNMRIYAYKRVYEITENTKSISADQLTDYLTEENEKTAAYIIEKTKDLLGDMLLKSFGETKLYFKFDTDL